MNLGKLITEGRNKDTLDIDKLDTIEMLQKINNEDKKVAIAVEKQLPIIAQAVDGIVEKIKAGGRLVYIGAGTSGRLGILDASECPPTFGTDPNLVVGIIAGGDKAIRTAVEGAEDSKEQGKHDLEKINLNKNDSVVGIAASGRTPYVIGALEYANEVGALTIGLSCNPDTGLNDVAKIKITPIVGPEVIMGSTRMKAGTAQKLILNMISTCTMIKIGKVYSNLMVDLQANNEKLVERAKRIVKLATGDDEQKIEEILKKTNYNVKLTILMIVTGFDETKGKRLLEESYGYIAKAIKNSERG